MAGEDGRLSRRLFRARLPHCHLSLLQEGVGAGGWQLPFLLNVSKVRLPLAQSSCLVSPAYSYGSFGVSCIWLGASVASTCMADLIAVGGEFMVGLAYRGGFLRASDSRFHFLSDFLLIHPAPSCRYQTCKAVCLPHTRLSPLELLITLGLCRICRWRELLALSYVLPAGDATAYSSRTLWTG